MTWLASHIYTHTTNTYVVYLKLHAFSLSLSSFDTLKLYIQTNYTHPPKKNKYHRFQETHTTTSFISHYIHTSTMMKINVDNEYLCAVRTKSFADFFIQAQLLLVPSSPSDLLLNPGQETVASLLKSSGNSRELNSVLFDYFGISAEASRLCTDLLKTLIHLQAIYINISNDKIIDPSTVSGLLDSPLAPGLDRRGFEEVQERHGRVLQRLRSGRRKMAGKLRVLEFLWGSCDGVMRGVVEQLDVAAKGVYVLRRDFDTVGRAVERIGGEVERDRAMVERGGWCVEEGEFGVRRQAEELEEHVYLCLLTINRARAMVVREICRSCVP